MSILNVLSTEKRCLERAGIQLAPMFLLESLTSSVFFPGLEGCECGPTASFMYMFIYTPHPQES